MKIPIFDNQYGDIFSGTFVTSMIPGGLSAGNVVTPIIPKVKKEARSGEPEDGYVPVNAPSPPEVPDIPVLEPIIVMPAPAKSWWTKALDGAQLFLDVAGFAGPVGPFADGLNAGISLFRGDFVGAGVNAIAIIPVIGDGIKAGKMVAKTGKAAGMVADAVKTTDALADTSKMAAKVENGISLAQTSVANGSKQLTKLGESATFKGTNSIKDTAEDLAKVVGKNRVTIKTPNKQIHYDLAGDRHYDKISKKFIDTPHVQERVFARGLNGKINIDESKSTIRPLTFQDIRVIKKHLNLE